MATDPTTTPPEPPVGTVVREPGGTRWTHYAQPPGWAMAPDAGRNTWPYIYQAFGPLTVVSTSTGATTTPTALNVDEAIRRVTQRLDASPPPLGEVHRLYRQGFALVDLNDPDVSATPTAPTVELDRAALIGAINACAKSARDTTSAPDALICAQAARELASVLLTLDGLGL